MGRFSIIKFVWVVLLCVITESQQLLHTDTNFNRTTSYKPIENIQHDESDRHTKNKHSSQIIENEFIVTFRKYMPHEEHELIITNIIGKQTGWSIITRNNPAWHLPSDFSLIKTTTSPKEEGRFLALLRGSSQVKHVVPQRRFTGVLNSVEEPSDSFNLNRTGRAQGKFSEEEREIFSPGMRKLHSSFEVPELFNAHYLWDKQFTGTGVKVAVFDTGLKRNHPHFKNVVEIKNWTDENTSDDDLGHGTFVTGVIASSSECLGFAPDVDIYVFRMFTKKKVSYTSWFLDAFNYAILTKINVLNLSIGGPDFMDQPFVEKVWELSANNIIVVSAIGNDGPLYGTLNNPADQLDVIGVGGMDFADRLALFSSRGMTTWELPDGYGRVKPDILAYGQSVQGSRINGGCKSLTGTSVASPVVAGAVALLASTVPEPRRWNVINPASMKQILVGAAERLPDANIFEQGFGKLNLLDSYELLSSYVPHASCIPAFIDLTNCPYMWPYCSQAIYYSGIPLMINTTILNGMGVSGEIPPEGAPVWKPGKNGHWLELSFTYPEFLWPWTGYMGIRVRVTSEAADQEGEAEGLVVFTVVSPPGLGEVEMRKTRIELPLKVKVIPTPPRDKRILWDQYHNLRYPSGYFPRDALDLDEPFDWNGDHIHTNFKDLYVFLRNKGYFIEVLGSPYVCFNASNYGTMIIMDSEEEFFSAEIKKLMNDFEDGLSLLIISDWYDREVMKKINFFDENTRMWWSPATGGSNVPALNELLSDFGISFGGRVFNGEYNMGIGNTYFSSGVGISRFPKGGSIATVELSDQSHEIMTGKNDKPKEEVPILGLWPTAFGNSQNGSRSNTSLGKSGRIAVYGDSSCFDDANKKQSCFWLIEDLLDFTMRGEVPVRLPLKELKESLVNSSVLPLRMDGNDLHKFSKVVGQTATCKLYEFKQVNKSINEIVQIHWEEQNNNRPPSSGKFREASNYRTPPSERDYKRNKNDLKVTFMKMLIVILAVASVAAYVMKYKRESTNVKAKRFPV